MEQAKMAVVRFREDDILSTSCGNLGAGWTKESFEAIDTGYGPLVDVTGNTYNLRATHDDKGNLAGRPNADLASADQRTSNNANTVNGNPGQIQGGTYYHIDTNSRIGWDSYLNWWECTDSSHRNVQ